MSDSMKHAIIIGAGPAGLTAAYELLSKTDILPIIIEQDKQPGGLSKTIDFKGNKIDIGGHRFFSKSDKIIKWWLHFLPLAAEGEQKEFHIQYKGARANFINGGMANTVEERVMMLRPRKSRIYFENKFYDYPLQFDARTLMNLGIPKTIGFALSYIHAKFFPVKPERSLSDFFQNRFGKRLYQTFFKSYTEKVWGVPCEELPATWGHQRVKDLSIGRVLKHAVKSLFVRNKTLHQKGTSTSLIEQFMYPKYGPGQMWETVAEAVERKGGKIYYNTTVTGLIGSQDNRLVSVETENSDTGETTAFNGDYFFSTMPIRELIGKIGNITVPHAVQKAAQSLEYRDFLIVGILASELAINETKEKFTDNWIYIQDKGIRAGRIQFFHNWSPYLVRNKSDVWIGVEYFCNESDSFWQQDDEVIGAEAISEMEKIGILKEDKVKDKWVVKVKKAYPSYFGGYRYFNEVQQYLDGFENLYPIGRNGMHRYNNTDHSMLTAMEAVENIITGRKDKSNIWDINTEEEYHEEHKV